MQFTPDGQLLQLGYASSAADHSPPLVVVELRNVVGSGVEENGDADAENKIASQQQQQQQRQQQPPLLDCLILMTIPRESDSSSSIHHQQQQRPPQPWGPGKGLRRLSPRRPQQRIIQMDDERRTRTKESSPTTSTSNSCCICLSGVLADSLALLKETLEECYDDLTGLIYDDNSSSSRDTGGTDRDFFSTVDVVEPVSWWKFAQSLAHKCHHNSLGGGIRPYGSSFVLCGYKQDYAYAITGATKNNDDSHHVHQRTKSFIYQTDPSGGIIVHDNNNVSSKPTAHVRCIVGGPSALQRELRRSINEELERMIFRSTEDKDKGDDASSPLTLADYVATIGRVLVEDKMSKDVAAGTTASGGNNDADDVDGDGFSMLPPLEVVIISPRLWSYRLKDQQLDKIEQLIHGQLQQIKEQKEKI